MLFLIKVKLVIGMNFAIFDIFSMPVLNPSMKAYRISQIVKSIFFISYMHCVLVEQWNQYTELAQMFIFHFLICSHSTSTIFLQLTNE